jgi:hypothetical protein
LHSCKLPLNVNGTFLILSEQCFTSTRVAKYLGFIRSWILFTQIPSTQIFIRNLLICNTCNIKSASFLNYKHNFYVVWAVSEAYWAL